MIHRPSINPPQRKEPGRRLFFGLTVLIASAAVPLIMLLAADDHGRRGFPLDDAWIHQVYGRSVSQGGYLAYNTGIPATGSTSPLWAYVLGLIHLVMRSTEGVVIATKVAGIFFHMIMALAVYKLIEFALLSRTAGLLAGLLAGMAPALVASSLSGMEVSLACASGLFGVFNYLKNRWLPAGILLGLSGLARPECALVISVIFLEGIFSRLQKKTAARDLLVAWTPVLLLGALFMGWNLAVDGRAFPATFYVKAMPAGGMGFLQRLAGGWAIIARDAPLAGGLVWVWLLGFGMADGRSRRVSAMLFCSGMAYFLGSIVLIPPSDPYAYYHIRYLLPAVPFLFSAILVLMLAAAKKALAERPLSGSRFFPAGRTVLIALVGLTILLLTVYSVFGLRAWGQKYSRDCRNINEVQVALGRAVAAMFPEKAVIGAVDAGAVRYFGRRFTIDLMGLNTRIDLSANCESQAVSALALMPAWIRLPKDHHLVPVVRMETRDYRVTSNPAMGHQLLAVCKSESGFGKRPISIQILGRIIHLCLECYDQAFIEQLARS